METQKKVVLVTGGHGLVGTALKKVIADERNAHPNERWVFVGSKDADLRDFEQTKALFEKHKPTHVIHCACVIASVFAHLNNNLKLFRQNMAINDNVLRASHEGGVNKVISCLSTSAFPIETTYPIDESMIQNGEPHSAYYGYSYAKRMILVLNRGYNQQYGRIYTAFSPCNMFGPNDNFHPVNSQVVSGIIRKMYDAKLRGDNAYNVYGSGKPLRQFMYSLDFARILIWATREYEKYEPLIAAVDEKDEITIAELAEVVKKCLKFEGQLVYNPAQPDGQYKKTASAKKLRSYLPNFKFTKFEDAMQETVDWFLKNQNNLREVQY